MRWAGRKVHGTQVTTTIGRGAKLKGTSSSPPARAPELVVHCERMR